MSPLKDRGKKLQSSDEIRWIFRFDGQRRPLIETMKMDSKSLSKLLFGLRAAAHTFLRQSVQAISIAPIQNPPVIGDERVGSGFHGCLFQFGSLVLNNSACCFGLSLIFMGGERAYMSASVRTRGKEFSNRHGLFRAIFDLKI
jgi:hypothetical protein